MTDNVSRVQNTMIRELMSNEMVISDSLGKKEEEDRDEEQGPQAASNIQAFLSSISKPTSQKPRLPLFLSYN
jgi:hypothetical protein